jgi:nucleoid DNA-binding protein
VCNIFFDKLQGKKMTKLTKNEIVDNIYTSSDVERKVIYDVIESFINQLRNGLEDGKTIELRGFGTLEPRLRKGRAKARNPKTGEKCTVEPHYVAFFRPGKDLKEKMWNLEVTEEKK